MMMKRWEKIAVIALVAADYHSGMSSRGYRLLCRSQRWLRHWHMEPAAKGVLSWTRDRGLLYEELAARYGDKL